MTSQVSATDRLSLVVYRALLVTSAAAAVALGVASGLDAPQVDPAHQLTEYWRAYGLLVFAALSACLASAPPGAAVVWLVVVFHKAAMTLTAVLLLRHGAAGAPAAAVVDGALVAVTLVALGLRRSAARASVEVEPHGRGGRQAQLGRRAVDLDREHPQLEVALAYRHRDVGPQAHRVEEA